MASRVQLPKDKHLAERVIQADADKQARDMGRIGVWLGSRHNAIIYLASTIIALALIAATILAVYEPTLRADAMKGVFAVIALVAGYMFGQSSKED